MQYALVGLLLAAFGVIDTAMDWRRGGWEPLGFCGPIAIYCAALAYGSVRLRSRSMGVPASAWVCAPLLLHGASGLLGALVPVLYAIGMEPRSFKEPLTDAAMFGVLLGCLPAMFPFLCARRGGFLLGAAVAGPLVLLVAIPFVHIHL